LKINFIIKRKHIIDTFPCISNRLQRNKTKINKLVIKMVKCKCYIYTIYVENRYNVDNIIFFKWIILVLLYINLEKHIIFIMMNYNIID
jgi:hypothetical protein